MASKQETERKLKELRVLYEKNIVLMDEMRRELRNKPSVETKISKTAEGELLIHKEDGKGGFINLIVDEDGDIELMHITKDRSKTQSKINASVDEAIEFWSKIKS